MNTAERLLEVPWACIVCIYIKGNITAAGNNIILVMDILLHLSVLLHLILKFMRGGGGDEAH
jgi:hypothetical protein